MGTRFHWVIRHVLVQEVCEISGMTNLALSPGVKLAWQLAGDLAVRETSQILPRHVLYGICSLEKLLNGQEKESNDDDAVLLA